MQKETTIPLPIIIKYILLQIPGLVLFGLVLLLAQRWIYIPSWIFWSFLVLWVIKDIILFPFVWRSYGTQGIRKAQDLIGIRGIATERLAPEGYVEIRGELWKVEVVGDGAAVEKGEQVQVVGRNNLTLLVKRAMPGEKF